MHPVWIFLTMMGMLIIQSTVLQVQPFSFVAPNIVLVMLLYVSLMRGPMLALYTGLTVGLVQDILFGTYLGPHAFTYALIGYFAGSTFRSYWARQLIMVTLIVIGYTFLQELTVYGLNRLFGFQRVDFMAAVTHCVRMMIWNGIFALILYVPSVKLLASDRRSGLADEAL
jgi:rod shape-determining protein MreD